MKRGKAESPGGMGRHLSMLAAWGLSVGYAVGWGAFVMPGTAFLPGAGPLGTLLGFLIGAAVMSVIAWNYHTLVSRWPCSGGAFSYAQDAFGSDYGFLTSWFLLLAYVSILWANATALVLVGRYVMGDFLQVGLHYRVAGFDIYLGEVAFSIAVVLAVGAINIAGKRLAARTNFVLAALLVLGVAACLVAAVVHGGGSLAAMSPAFSPLKGASPTVQVMRVLAMIPWAFVGFEAISNSSAEFSFGPRRTFGVLLAAVVASTFVYVGLALLPVLSLPEGYSDWAAYIKARPSFTGVDAFPVLAATRRILGAAGVPVFCVMIIGGIVTGIFGAIVATSRLLHSMAEEDVIPAWFGRLNRDGAPRNAMLAVIGVSLLVPFFGRTAVGWPVDVSSIGAAIAYFLVSAAAFKNAIARGDSLTKATGVAGAVLSVFFGVLLLVPTYISGGVLAAESYLLLALWGLCGFFFYRHVFKHHRERYGHSSVVWVGVLVLIIFSSLMWVRQQTHSSIDGSVEEIRTFYKEARTSRRIPAVDDSAVMREVDFMASRMERLGDEILEYDFVKFILLTLALGLVFSLYRTQQWREKAMAIAKARADESNRAKTSFLSNMSHDIRTPMNAIIGYTELSKRPGVTEQTLREYMTKIEASSHHLLALVNDVLEMARIESGKMSLEPAPIDLVKTLDEVRDMFATQMSVKKIDFAVDTSQVRNRYVMCDKNRLNRILLNLVSNAWKFTPDRGHVSIRAVQHGEAGANAAVYELRVKDTGIGMSQSFAARVFEAFEREQTSTVSRIQGSGLGMSITKSIVDLMKGEISVDTEQGKGTEFTVRLTLPFASADDVETALGGPDASLSANSADFSSRRLLLVEDNPINREIATCILKDAGFTVDEAENGREAVEKVSQGGVGFYDAVLMDVQMPVMNGYEATRTIRAMNIPGLSDVPIIALSANAFESDVRTAKDAGMDEHVAKPFRIAELMNVLAKHLGKRGTAAAKAMVVESGNGTGETGGTSVTTPASPVQPVSPAPNSPQSLIAALYEMGCDVKGTIDKTFMGKEEFYSKMFAKLPSNAAIGRMRAAFDAKDAKSLFEASHELKGVYASLGLAPLYDVCSEIVEIARAGGLDGVADLLPSLEEMHAEIVNLAKRGLASS